MKPGLFFVVVGVCVAVLAAGPAVRAQGCTTPNDDFPPDCLYDSPEENMEIIDGLPAGSTIGINGPIQDIVIGPNGPGGTLGGEYAQFQATLVMDMNGTGSLAGFRRYIYLPLSGEVYTGPRTAGSPVQDFDTEMFRLEGELSGYPDFCTFRLRAGSYFGLLPSSGHTTLTEQPGGGVGVGLGGCMIRSHPVGVSTVLFTIGSSFRLTSRRVPWGWLPSGSRSSR